MPTKQSLKCVSQDETYEERNRSESSTIPNLTLSDTTLLNDKISSESESVQLLDTTDEEVDDILKEMAYEFNFSSEKMEFFDNLSLSDGEDDMQQKAR